jgi:hypothetical protein
MSDVGWHTRLTQVKEGLPQCLLACCCGYLGVCAVQAYNGKLRNGKACKPFLCAACLLCFGMAINRKAVRQEYQIPGNCIVESLLYMCGCCFLVSQEYREIDYRKGKRIVTVQKPPVPLPLQKPEPRLEPQPDPKQPDPPASQQFPEKDASPPDILIPMEDNHGVTKKLPVSAAPAENLGSDMPAESEPTEDDLFPPALDEVAITPIDGDDPFIYSRVLATPPFSFLLGIPPNTAPPSSEDYYPAPTYLPYQQLSEPKPQLSREIWVGLEKDQEGGMVCTDKEALKRQEGVASHVMKQLGWAIIKGLGAVSISLPIRIFEPRSTCERLIDRFSFAPVFLKQAAKMTDPMGRLKQVLAFAVASLYLGVKQEKPFNPILGETMQGAFPDGAKIYCEHTMHNPPTDHFYIDGPGYTVYGYYQLNGSFTGNSLVGSFTGPTTVYFHADGQTITYTQPKFRLGGVLMGKRTLNWEGDMEFEDPGNNWIAVIKIQTTDKAYNPRRLRLRLDQFIGKVYVPQGSRRDRIEREIGVLEGSWMEELRIDGEKLWQLDVDLPLRHTVAENPLPSDWRYREDLIWLFRGNQTIAQAWKVRLEQRQRDDRQKRVDGAKRRKH